MMDADQFDVVFPVDADNEMRATLTGGVFLFKELYYARRNTEVAQVGV
jgi:hypothetical protein